MRRELSKTGCAEEKKLYLTDSRHTYYDASTLESSSSQFLVVPYDTDAP